MKESWKTKQKDRNLVIWKEAEVEESWKIYQKKIEKLGKRKEQIIQRKAGKSGEALSLIL